MGLKLKFLMDFFFLKCILGNNRIWGDVECFLFKKLKIVYELKCINLEEWFDDVIFVSVEKEFLIVGIEREVFVYFGVKNILMKI